MRWLAVAFGVFALALSVLANTDATWLIARVVERLPGRDVTGHFLLTGLLTLFGILGFADDRIGGRPIGALRCALGVAVLTTVDELVQIVLPHRSFTLVDLGAGYAGVVCFSLLGWAFLGARTG